LKGKRERNANCLLKILSFLILGCENDKKEWNKKQVLSLLAIKTIKIEYGMKKLFANGSWQKILALFFIFLQIVLVATFAYLFAVDGLYRGAYVPLLGTYLALQIFFECYAFYTTTEPEYKIAWMFAIGALPIVGILFFVLFANKRIAPRKKRASIRLMKRLSLEPTSIDTKKRILAILTPLLLPAILKKALAMVVLRIQV